MPRHIWCSWKQSLESVAQKTVVTFNAWTDFNTLMQHLTGTNVVAFTIRCNDNQSKPCTILSLTKVLEQICTHSCGEGLPEPCWGKGVAHVEEQNTDKAIMVWQDEKSFKVGRMKVAVQWEQKKYRQSQNGVTQGDVLKQSRKGWRWQTSIDQHNNIQWRKAYWWPHNI